MSLYDLYMLRNKRYATCFYIEENEEKTLWQSYPIAWQNLCV